ncbi:hypothetical protein AAH145_04830 [Bacteroides thetaiotaomicron]
MRESKNAYNDPVIVAGVPVFRFTAEILRSWFCHPTQYKKYIIPKQNQLS